MKDAARRAWISLASVEGIGETILGDLLARFGSAQQVLEATVDGSVAAWIEERRAADGRPPISSPTLARVLAVALNPDAKLTEVVRHGLWTLTPFDEGYPEGLRDLAAPPAVIFGRGDMAALKGRTVGVVGTRRPTPAGRSLASRVCARLVECNARVISGLAIGIDGAAHAATLERGGVTVGVIGGGHAHPGPRAHARLRDEIVASGGAVISEHHPSVHPTKGTYPRRNRIIAALSNAVVVIEAPRVSGALITANRALELGRPVLVAPGRIGEWATAGSLALLRDSPARPLVGLDELVEDLGYFATGPDEADRGTSGTRAPALQMLGPAERTVATRLCQGPAGLDLLVAETGLAPSVISSAITLLLMRGWAQSHGPAFMAAGPLATP
jgi:DNA processing protein